MTLIIFALVFVVPCEGLRVNKQEECSLNGAMNLQTQPHQAPLEFEGFDHGTATEGLYLNTKAKFAFCLIEKNACSMWTTIFGKLESGDLNFNSPKYGIAQWSFDAKAAKTIFQDPSATRAVFVRDPLERFLSAFLNKCFGRSCADNLCAMRPQSMKGQKIPFSMAVEWLRNKDPATGDGHWKLQSKHCELDKRVHEYNQIVLMEPSTMSADAACLLEKAQLSRLNTRGDKEGNVPFWQPNVESFSKVEENHDVDIELLKSFYTREAAELVYKKLEEDYKTFSIPRPAWINEAHGELFNSTGKFECKSKAGFTKEFTEHDEDDILTLAHQAGYKFSI